VATPGAKFAVSDCILLASVGLLQTERYLQIDVVLLERFMLRFRAFYRGRVKILHRHSANDTIQGGVKSGNWLLPDHKESTHFTR